MGFLLHAESLLSTRGNEWTMLQDALEAIGMLGSVTLAIGHAGDAACAGGGVWLKGTRHAPILAFAPSELGFKSAEHAERLGVAAGALIKVCPVMLTQGAAAEPPLAARRRSIAGMLLPRGRLLL